MLATAFLAASSKSFALLMGSPDSLRIFLAASTLVPEIQSKFNNNINNLFLEPILPSKRTIKGTLSSIDLEAPTIPDAIVAQLTMPPKTFTKMAFTFLSKENLFINKFEMQQDILKYY